MSERDSFLLRWARLKQAANAAEETDAASAHFDAMVEPPATEMPFDPTSLPSVESIAADTDVIAFLRAGVPAELRQAALRKVWTSDPAIRDFIGIAENQWDFNDPNAIPGFGPLTPTESGVDILAQISTRLEQLPSTLEELTAAVEPAPANADEQSLRARLAAGNSPPARPGAAPHELPAAGEGENAPAANGTRKRRRHGSALPG
jgi:Protein of unknown function (DUF3306)